MAPDFETHQTGTHKAITEKDMEIESLKRRIEHHTEQQESLYKCAEKAAETGEEQNAGVMVTNHGVVDIIMRPHET